MGAAMLAGWEPKRFTERSNDANRFVTDIGSTTLALSLVLDLAALVGVAALLSRHRRTDS